jgi:hypothetical protein
MRSAVLLLSILALVVRGVIGIVLRLLISTLLVASPCVATSGITCAWITSTICLGRTIALLLSRSGGLLPIFGTPPRRYIRTTCRDIVTGTRTTPGLAPFGSSTCPFAQFSHQASVLGIETASHLGRGRRGVGVLVYCTISRHMPGATTDTADDVSSEVPLLWTIIFAMANATTVLANLVFVIP